MLFPLVIPGRFLSAYTSVLPFLIDVFCANRMSHSRGVRNFTVFGSGQSSSRGITLCELSGGLA